MRICVYCGSSGGRGETYADAARALATTLTEREIGLVYGGASVGTMGVLADAMLEAGGEVIGIIPRQLLDREIAHHGLTDLRVVADMHERKAQMAAVADAFVALPGGVGTLEELFEVWTWGQLSLHHKPLGLLDVDGYFSALSAFADHMVAEGFLAPAHRAMLHVESDPLTLLDRFAAYVPPPDKWAAQPALLGATPAAAGPGVRREHPPVSADEPPVDALAWVHIRDGKLLVVRSAGRDAFYLPGGKREPGESDVRALARELREELGVELRADSLTLVSVIEDEAHGERNRALRMACYEGTAEGELLVGAEIVELDWVDSASADQCAPAARRLVDELHERGDVR